MSNIIGVVFLKKIPTEAGTKYQEMTEDNKEELMNSEQKEKLNLFGNSQEPLMVNYHGELTLYQAAKTTDFHLLFWACVIANSISFTYTFNLLVYLRSFKLEDFKTTLLVTGTVTAALSKMILGITADKTLKKLPRVVYYIIMVSLLTLVTFLSCFIGDKDFIVVLTTMISFFGTAISMSFVPLIVCDTFGTTHHSAILGAIYLGTGLGNVLISVLMGALYDLEIEDGSNTCYGLKCFRKIFIIDTFLCLAALVMLGFLYKRTRQATACA